MSPVRTILLGGTFDPPHLGHLSLAEAAALQFPEATIYLVPAARNPLKGQPSATNEQRGKMVQLALEELANPRIKPLLWELERPAPSYTIDTLERAAKELAQPMALLLGNEVLANFSRWKSPEKIVKLASLIVVARDPKSVISSPGAAVLSMQRSPYSSTTLRTTIADGWNEGKSCPSPKGLQHSVWQFIKEFRLYAV